MQLTLGQKIRELRHRDGRTQETLAEAHGVTSQAISRWEANGGYPDMEMIPAIANYFHISIDELFGYSTDREEKINDIIKKADMILKSQGRIIVGTISDEIRECINMLRAASEEFPNEPKILLKLAEALNMYGYNKYGAKGQMVDELGTIIEDIEYNSHNIYWQEAISVYEKLLKSNPIPKDRNTAIIQLTPLYCRMGEFQKAKALADNQSSLAICKEMLLPMATVGEEKVRYQGESITALLSNLRFVIYHSLASKPSLSASQYKKQILLSLINLYETVFADGRFGIYHWDIGHLYLTLTQYEITQNNNQDAMNYFDKGFDHYKQYEMIINEGKCSYTAPLVSNLTVSIEDTPSPIGDDFWKKELKLFPERFRNELRKIHKYSICFE